MRTIGRWAVLFWAMACGISEEDYATRALDAACEKWEECAGEAFDPEIYCLPVTGAESVYEGVDYTYDPVSAQSCLDAIGAATCEGSTWTYPNVCEDVYTVSG